MGNLSNLKDSALMQQLTVLKEDLEEVQTEKKFVLGQTGLHISGSKIAQQTREYEEDTLRLQGLIAEIEAEVKRRGLESK
ncbi:hypothetical protein [Dehalobacter restrictus]|uniref:hypothetical protein n=1 Tax=Dehalobacter restrictus TaxID=55583 RepID=UPI0033903039